MDADAIVTVQPDSEDTPPLDIGPLKHEPLRDSETQIRLIRLKPGRQDDNIELELTTWDFAISPNYHAISYTWGADVRRIVFINGLAHWVRHNCHYALMQARLHYPETYLWLDSICIDQEVYREKSHQVSIMKDIYVKADWVLACIGPHENGSQVILEVVDHVMRLEDPPTLESLAIEATPTLEQWYHWLSWLNDWSDAALYNLRNSLRKFVIRDYWTRLWIAQEIAAADGRIQIFCGMDTLNWEAFHLISQLAGLRRLAGAFERLSGVTPLIWMDGNNDSSQPVTSHVKSLCTTRLASVTLDEALEHTIASECSDPRDRVFGILSLVAWPRRRTTIVPDYAMSRLQVALEAIRHIRLFQSLLWLAVALRLRCCDFDMLALRQVSRRSDDVRVRIEAFRVWSARLAVGASGRLAACIRKSSDRVPDEDDNFFYRLPQAFDENECQNLVVDGEIAGHLCSDAEPGDVIVNLDSKKLLILRENADGRFDVVGQGLLGADYEISDEVIPESGQVKVAAMVNIVMDFTVADALLLVAQDLFDAWSGTGGKSRTYDSKARAERLIVNPFSSPLNAVSLTPSPPVDSEMIHDIPGHGFHV
ncbi:unnamed protein product [Zymoseptoria tritici ST99CH_3D1]|nr:unnamed protein product [Zymoseptoria tritici ST99CH_3D1]